MVKLWYLVALFSSGVGFLSKEQRYHENWASKGVGAVASLTLSLSASEDSQAVSYCGEDSVLYCFFLSGVSLLLVRAASGLRLYYHLPH